MFRCSSCLDFLLPYGRPIDSEVYLRNPVQVIVNFIMKSKHFHRQKSEKIYVTDRNYRINIKESCDILNFCNFL